MSQIKKVTANAEFRTLTMGKRRKEVAKIFNSPRDLNVSPANITGWRCTDPTKTYYRNMPPMALEIFKIKLKLIDPHS
ncbi:MAG: hypothetical protein GWN00_19970 [Aliifodinibius sp.]|nr:hypothetical protein [Fodinibius sp.]NIY26999.1 hypothetical protein [Fodinibius sp.]